MVSGSEGLGERSAQYNAASALPPFQLQIRTAASGQASSEREEQQMQQEEEEQHPRRGPDLQEAEPDFSFMY